MKNTAYTPRKLPEIYRDMANAIRALSMDAVEIANSGHPGMPLGTADIATVLYASFLKYDPSNPEWPDRDRFILSAGHGSMLLYSLLYLSGYPDIDIEEIRNFRQMGSRTAGHPEYGAAAGIETTTGPLGQGLATSVGMALAEKMHSARFGKDIVDHYTYVLASDGDLMEGISQEAISLAGHMKLKKLIVLYDSNNISIDGATDITLTDDAVKRVEASGWSTFLADGHNTTAIYEAIEKARENDRPSLIVFETKIGFGAPTKENSESSHGAPLGKKEIEGAREKLNWPHAPFFIPPEILAKWREAGAASADLFKAWTDRLANTEESVRLEYDRTLTGALPDYYHIALNKLKKDFVDKNANLASRVASKNTLDVLCNQLPELIGGSADLSGSNGTRSSRSIAITPTDFSGNYIHYGVREHAMAAAMNGIALHGGFIPYGGTFLIFTDYCRPAIRLSALMKQRVIYVMTHDSIGLGEDGPTHQPIEHLAALRAIPNLNVFRPADSVETIECWQLAINSKNTPSILALSRQGLPLQRKNIDKNMSERGGYILEEASTSNPKVILIATGSEIEIAIAARAVLEEEGVSTRVVSLPCWEIFDKQKVAYRDGVLGTGNELRIGIEAGSSFGWERYLGANGIMIGMRGFGASAPADQLFDHFGITTTAIVEGALKHINE